MDSGKTVMYFALGLTLIALLIAIPSLTKTNRANVAGDVATDHRDVFINLPSLGSGGLVNYNIVQIVNSSNPRTIQAVNSQTGAVESQSTTASTVFQYVMNQVNSAGGGHVHVTGYSTNGTLNHAYNITISIKLPDSGYLNIYGDGATTVLRIPSTSDNIYMFYVVGTKTVDNFLNTWRDMRLEGNIAGTNNTALQFDGQVHGYHDSLFEGLFIENFATDDVFISSANAWNMQFTNDIFELANRYCLEHTGGSDTRIVSSKFLFCHSTSGSGYAVQFAGGLNTISSSWFYQNSKSAILLGNQPNVIVANKFFDNGLSAPNTYYDIALSSATNSVINSNTFSASDQTNKTKCAIDIGDSASINNNINANNFTPNAGASYGTAPICGFHSSGVNQMSNNVGWNPRGKITNFIDNSGLFFVSQAGTTNTLVNGTTYTISDSPIFLSSTGGTAVAITLQDNNGNTIQSGLTTLTAQFVPVGYKVKWTWATIPTATVYYQ